MEKWREEFKADEISEWEEKNQAIVKGLSTIYHIVYFIYDTLIKYILDIEAMYPSSHFGYDLYGRPLLCNNFSNFK